MTAFCGAINGSVAIDLVCASLLSLPEQLISSRSINGEQFEKYSHIPISGRYESKTFWVNDYTSMCGIVGKQISGGVHYARCKGILPISRIPSNMFEIIIGKTPEKNYYDGEAYTNYIKPVFYVDIRNPTLELEKKNGVWTFKL